MTNQYQMYPDGDSMRYVVSILSFHYCQHLRFTTLSSIVQPGSEYDLRDSTSSSTSTSNHQYFNP